MAKATKKQVLGRGLGAGKSALLKNINDIKQYDNAADIVGNVIQIPMSDIEENPFQPRKHFDSEALEGLASSIKELGLIQPITVRRINDKFQLVSGERRFRASQYLGNKTIPAYVRVANDQEILEMALVENLQREDLDPIEIALCYQRLLDEIQSTQELLSIRVGKKRSTITNYLRLLKLDPIVQTGIRDGFITMGHGRSLISLKNVSQQLKVYQKIIKDGLSVRATEELIQKLKSPQEAKKKTQMIAKLGSVNKETTQSIENFLKVDRIKVTANDKGKGTIGIPFQSEEDFQRILSLLRLKLL